MYVHPTDTLNHSWFFAPDVICCIPLKIYYIHTCFLHLGYVRVCVRIVAIVTKEVVTGFAERTPFMENMAFTDAMINGDPRGKQCINIHYWENCHTSRSCFAITCLLRRNIKLSILLVESTFANWVNFVQLKYVTSRISFYSTMFLLADT